jgi:pimeloyl-ACP methyl ester carboxylesterase
MVNLSVLQSLQRRNIIRAMDYGDWIKSHLERVAIDNDGHTVSVWCSKDDGKPLLVLVHGISGDHVGLVPLAVELLETYRIAMIDLPGHGGSDQIPLPDARTLQAWVDAMLMKIEQAVGSVAAVCAHSFGCSSVLSDATIKNRCVILLNPVPSPSGMYASYSRMIMDSAHFWAHIYNWPPFIMLRGMTLTKLPSREVLRRVRWTGLHSRPTFDQIVFQAGLVDMILDGSAYDHAKDGVALVVCGMYDTTSRQRDTLDMEAVFGNSKVVFLKGGHLLPIESPDRVAKLIREAVVQ